MTRSRVCGQHRRTIHARARPSDRRLRERDDGRAHWRDRVRPMHVLRKRRDPRRPSNDDVASGLEIAHSMVAKPLLDPLHGAKMLWRAGAPAIVRQTAAQCSGSFGAAAHDDRARQKSSTCGAQRIRTNDFSRSHVIVRAVDEKEIRAHRNIGVEVYFVGLATLAATVGLKPVKPAARAASAVSSAQSSFSSNDSNAAPVRAQ